MPYPFLRIVGLTAAVLLTPRISSALDSSPDAAAIVDALTQESGRGLTRGIGSRPKPSTDRACASWNGASTVSNTRGLGRNLEVVAPYLSDAPFINIDLPFVEGSEKLQAQGVESLKRLVSALRSSELSGKRFAIAGHTNSKGSAALNLRLSCARAQAVVEQLTASGVSFSRLSAYGFGSERPLPGLDPADGANRRVEIRLAE